jgi:hypothetical protein
MRTKKGEPRRSQNEKSAYSSRERDQIIHSRKLYDRQIQSNGGSII